MKKLYLSLFLLIICFSSQSQITITQNDIPHENDTARYTNAALNLFIDYNSTGPNHTWDFSDLRSASQGLQQFIDVSSTNIVYAIVFANIPFLPNRSNVASNTTELPTSPLVPLTNPYNFYYRNSSEYRQTGFGAEIAGLPVPITYNNHDVIYKLPLDYGDSDTSSSDWNINIPGVGDLGYWQTRTNEVDGWGTLITPYSTYNVLRVKTTRAQRDTVALDTLFGFAVDRPLVREYKWLTNGEVIPVMQITTMDIFGLEVVTNIFFRDEFIKIETQPLAAQVFCAGSSIDIPYTEYGTFNGPGLFTSGNVFTAQLSDSSGSFANPVNIGTLTSTQSGTINGIIPAGTIPGNHYRVRVVSSNLPVEGTDNGTDMVIFNSPPVIDSIAVSGSLVLCAGDSVMLSVDTSVYFSYQWMVNGTPVPGGNSASYTAATAGNYSVAVTNVCGTDTSLIAPVTIQSVPTAAISTASLMPCAGDTIILNSLTTDASSFQWQLNGADLPGETNPDLSVTADGSYTLIATGICGTITSNSLNISFGAAPVAAAITASANSVCAGDSVLLIASVVNGNLQWQLNGVDITGATTYNLFVNTSGNYTVLTTNQCGSAVSNPLTIIVNPLPSIPIVSLTNDTLYSTPAAAYQWYYNGTVISGANAINYHPLQDGAYTVVITDANGCTAISAVYNYSSVGIENLDPALFNIYPNPAGSVLNVDFGKQSIHHILIRNMLGAIVLSYSPDPSENNIKIAVDPLTPGYYNLQCITLNGLSNHRFLKE